MKERVRQARNPRASTRRARPIRWTRRHLATRGSERDAIRDDTAALSPEAEGFGLFVGACRLRGPTRGLAIVDRWVRGRGGRFELLPREGGGLLARITIPAP